MKNTVVIGLVLNLWGCAELQRPWDAGLLKPGNHEAKWDPRSLPITPSFNVNVPTETVAAYIHAATEINEIVGTKLFELKTPGNGRANLHIKPCKVQCGSLGGTTRLFIFDRFILAAEIKLRKLKAEKILMVLRHELGHVLGLAHDEDPTSIMNGSLKSFFLKEKVWTDKDRRLLQKLYCKKGD